MPEVHVRNLIMSDLPILVGLDHRYITDSVWQLQLQVEQNRVNVNLKEIRLPRSVQVEYPKSPNYLADEWALRPGVLVALVADVPVGYLALAHGSFDQSIRATDMAVARKIRRQGVGKALLLAGQEWAREHGYKQIILEVQSKNVPAINLVQKLGFDFCGYNDQYYQNKDIAMFWSKILG